MFILGGLFIALGTVGIVGGGIYLSRKFSPGQILYFTLIPAIALFLMKLCNGNNIQHVLDFVQNSITGIK